MESAPIPLETLMAHHGWVRALARTLVLDDGAADDVVQQTWLAALRSPPRHEATARAWLARVVRNFARERHRAESRRRRREEAAAVPEGRGGAAPDDIVARAECHKLVVTAVMDLEEPYRTTVLLRYFEGLAPRHVAERMGVPVDTVRTRTRRALEQLRGHFDRKHGGDRRAWALLLLPLAVPDPAVPGVPIDDDGGRDGGTMVMMLKTVAAVMVLLGGGAGVMLWDAGTEANPPPAPTRPGETARADRDEVTRGRGDRDGDPPAGDVDATAPEETGSASSEDEAATDPVEAADPSALRLRISVEPSPLVAGEAVRLIAEFTNEGDRPLPLFVPSSASYTPWPRWRLRSGDGAEVVPLAAPVQVSMQPGMQGKVVRIEPGASFRHVNHVTEFATVDPATGEPASWWEGEELQPGRYVFECSHEKSAPTVPYAEDWSSVEQRPVEGLWVGRTRADDVAGLVEASGKPTMTVEPPEAIVPGRPAVLTVHLRNPQDTERVFRGAFTVSVGSKGEGRGYANLVADEGELLRAATGVGELRLPAGGERVLRVDLSHLTYDWTGAWGTRRKWRDGLASLRRPGVTSVSVAFVEEGKERPTFRRWEFAAARVPDATSHAGLVLRATTRDDGTAAFPVLELTLRNGGTTPVQVPRTLTNPGTIELFGRGPEMPEGSHMRLGGRRVPVSAATEFVELGVGETLRGTIDLAPLLAREEGDTFAVRARWVNFEDGRRDGHGGTSIATGRRDAGWVQVKRLR